MKQFLRMLLEPIRAPLRWLVYRVAGIPRPVIVNDGLPDDELLQKVSAPGGHGTAIGEYFGTQAHVAADAPRVGVQLVVLAFFNRSGSNLLASQLRDSGAYRGFRELLNHGNVERISEQHGLRSFAAYLRHIAADAERAGVPFGVKATAAQIGMLHYYGALQLFPRADVVHIERDDLLGQAISFCIANDTKRWSSLEKREVTGEPEYDAQRIAWVMREIAMSNLRVRLACEVAGLRRIPVSYEELAADGPATLQRISEQLGVALDPDRLPPPRMEKQASAINEEFRKRFLAELG